MTVLLDSQTTNDRIEPDRIENIAENLLGYTGMTGYELSILLVDDARITELNATYRRKDKPTNVLSFPLLEPEAPELPNLLGDIVISVETAVKEAEQQKIDPGDYLIILLVHGFIHLLGHDHEKGEKEADEMAGREKELLQKLRHDELIELNVESLMPLTATKGAS